MRIIENERGSVSCCWSARCCADAANVAASISIIDTIFLFMFLVFSLTMMQI